MNAPTDPRHISISKSKGIRIEWQDGRTSEFSLQYLRDKCPCATCTGAHGSAAAAGNKAADPFPMFRPALKIASVEPVGSYAITIVWSDGHDSGIFTWDYLRSISD
jgi:DUF971 family protein